MAAQRGLITRQQLLALGATDRQIRARVSSGRWLVAEAGVYRHAAAAPDDLAPLLAAILATSGRASHRSGLHLYGLYELQARPEFVAERTSGYTGRGRVYRKDLTHFGLTRRQGIPVLDLTGTFVTAAAVLDGVELHDVVAAAINRRLITAPLLARNLAAFKGAHKGIGTLRTIAERYVDTRAEESRLESAMLRVLRRAGLEPVVGHAVRVGGKRFRLDAAFVAEKVALEADGYEFHSSRAAFDRDRVRRNLLELAGWLVLNVTSRMVYEQPHELVRHVRVALRRAS